VKILMDHTNEGIAKRFDDVTHTELTEGGAFYVITRKDSRLYISTNTILWFNETPEEGDDDLFS